MTENQANDDRRPLTPEESRILHLVQAFYGDRNTEGKVIFANKRAVIWAENNDGDPVIVFNLTNIAVFASHGNLSDKQIIEQWLMGPASHHR